jgi:hypothetical protein
MAPSFSMACRRFNLSPGRNRISIAYGSDGKLNLSGVSQRKREWILILAYCQTIPPPPAKGRMFAMRQRDPSPPGG